MPSENRNGMQLFESSRSMLPATSKATDPSSNEHVWHSLSCQVVQDQLQTSLSWGLSHSEASRRLERYGKNVLAQAKQRSALSIFVAQFRSLIVALLAAATVIAIATDEQLEAATIFVVIILNACVGFFTEWKAQRALTALQQQAKPIAHVIRSGTTIEIATADLVPGDLVVLAAGMRVPADGRIVESERLQIEEAALTGESSAIYKSTQPIHDTLATLGDRLNIAFCGTTVTEGRGKILVTSTGRNTEVGKIGVLIDDTILRSTPLENKLTKLGHTLVAIVLTLCSIIVVAGLLRGTSDFLHMLKIGLSLAIAAVPEGLPAVTTMSLALGMQRMARMRALVRRLSAVETLGSVTVICTDKTGTLTKNEMTVCVFALDQRQVKVTGSGYEPVGVFRENQQTIDPNLDQHLTLALRIGALCNDARVMRSADPQATLGDLIVLGDPTEAALVVAIEKAGIRQTSLHSDYPRLSEIPFDSLTKRMVTVHQTPQGDMVAFVKGAPGDLITSCNSRMTASGIKVFDPTDRDYLHEANQNLAAKALRVLGLAYRELPKDYTADDLSKELIFVGLVGMSDPLRQEAQAAISTCRQAGIRTIMITGDQSHTAAEIARQLGIAQEGDGTSRRIIHGRELANLDGDDWKKIVTDAAVFARVSPKHKLQIVEALQQQGHVVAMTGDGVNDAPALKKADIGIAMGIKGTEVAKENADMVITDDNFASIVEAVEQGRVIYGNILRFLHYLLSCNLSEILTVFFALMIGWPLPLVALQILWLNLITDIFPAFALAMEKSSPDVMKRTPRDPQEPLLTWDFSVLIAWQGTLLAIATLVAFGIGLRWYGNQDEGLQRASTMAFMTLALVQIVHVFDARSQSRSIFTSRLFTNAWLWTAVTICVLLQIAAVYTPLLRTILHTVWLSKSEWLVILSCSLIPVALVETVKWLKRSQHSHANH